MLVEVGQLATGGLQPPKTTTALGYESGSENSPAEFAGIRGGIVITVNYWHQQPGNWTTSAINAVQPEMQFTTSMGWDRWEVKAHMHPKGQPTHPTLA